MNKPPKRRKRRSVRPSSDFEKRRKNFVKKLATAEVRELIDLDTLKKQWVRAVKDCHILQRKNAPQKVALEGLGHEKRFHNTSPHRL
jgi:hypothetical protein